MLAHEREQESGFGSLLSYLEGWKGWVVRSYSGVVKEEDRMRPWWKEERMAL